QKDHLVCKLPLQVLCQKFGVQELRDLCLLHADMPKITSRHVRDAVIDILLQHECTAKCESSYSVLAPLTAKTRPNAYAGLLEIDSPVFAECIKILPREALHTFLTEEQIASTPVGFKVKRVFRTGHITMDPGDFTLKNIPLAILARHMPIQAMRSIAAHHGLNIPGSWIREKCVQALQHHRCDRCVSLHFLLSPVNRSKPAAAPHQGSWVDTSEEPILWDAEVSMPTDVYPPRPVTIHDIATAMKGYCAELSPEAIEESGCCVCAQLTKRSVLVPFEEMNYADLGVLEQHGCTRQERTSLKDPILEIQGPRGKRPKMALANSLWVGDVPDCLKDLTLAECALISRVRYNRCVVRVSQGHAKMVANVISFEHPSKKIYERLPVDKDELSEVLSITYTGVDPPSDGDLKRTPVLVRRDKVRTTLEWLKVNNKEYTDLSIDYETLETYDLEKVPIGILRRDIVRGEGNVLASEKSVFDNEIEQ
ncbi:hypothetical protein DFP72DRAFT_784205, partial [Ephemerocybe angulata]